MVNVYFHGLFLWLITGWPGDLAPPVSDWVNSLGVHEVGAVVTHRPREVDHREAHVFARPGGNGTGKSMVFLVVV